MNKLETNVIKPDLAIISNDVEYRIITKATEDALDKALKDTEDFMLNNSKKGQSEEKQIELYSTAKNMWKEYFDLHSVTKYSFFLNRKQYQFLTDLILTKLEYDVNTVFFAIGLTDLLGTMKDSKDFTNDTDLQGFEVNATEITYIYHLISKHKVKGLTKDSYLFSELLIKIGGISKVFNYYETANKNLSTDIQNWVIALQDGVTTDESTTANVVEPKGKKKAKAE